VSEATKVISQMPQRKDLVGLKISSLHGEGLQCYSLCDPLLLNFHDIMTYLHVGR